MVFVDETVDYYAAWTKCQDGSLGFYGDLIMPETRAESLQIAQFVNVSHVHSCHTINVICFIQS